MQISTRIGQEEGKAGDQRACCEWRAGWGYWWGGVEEIRVSPLNTSRNFQNVPSYIHGHLFWPEEVRLEENRKSQQKNPTKQNQPSSVGGVGGGAPVGP